MFIPGRIEVLGKHTDYCGGRSIVCAIDRGFHVVELFARGRLIFLGDRSQPLLSFLHFPALRPQKLNPRGLQRFGFLRGAEGLRGVCLESVSGFWLASIKYSQGKAARSGA